MTEADAASRALTVRVPEDLYVRLAAYKVRNRSSFQELIVDAIEDMLNEARA